MQFQPEGTLLQSDENPKVTMTEAARYISAAAPAAIASTSTNLLGLETRKHKKAKKRRWEIIKSWLLIPSIRKEKNRYRFTLVNKQQSQLETMPSLETYKTLW